MSTPLVLEPAEQEDLDVLVALERACFSHPWTPHNFTDAMADPPRSRVVVLRTPPSGEADRGIAAYCVYQVVAGEVHVHNLAVRPGFRRAGLGRVLMRLVLEVAARMGARVALLEVRRSNEAARRLYESLGFGVRTIRRNYYSRPPEDALLMDKVLP